MDSDEEAYILLLLSDGNLPTGSFVASSGLESYVTHGFFTIPPNLTEKGNDKLEHIVDFIRDTMSTYARSALPFVSDAHIIVEEAMKSHGTPSSKDRTEQALRTLLALDALYESMTLNHIARRASTAQGVALLSLHSKGFSVPRIYPATQQKIPVDDKGGASKIASILADKLKLLIRREETPGHLPICWGFLTAALGLSLDRSQFLHLFLCARGALSAAVRMNICGPYAAQQLLLHAIRPIVVAEASRCAKCRTGVSYSSSDMGEVSFDEGVMTKEGPAITWPLGEILAARHDLQHSRVFNS
ncbi:hypothetical protein BDY19DRAFT_884614 [Irpex rosettiformis]|uniref:Uncharacterized protein n=1 Tax=Irpex rosettiformis TaxID=378272 RepID=A0ACB8UCP3_9APHY|nr:hypothetical protein BDY19DRAFT_884614 [Irpex rosettiformis]